MLGIFLHNEDKYELNFSNIILFNLKKNVHLHSNLYTMSLKIQEVHKVLGTSAKFDFKAGDTITVHYKIKEGEKERVQQFQGIVLQRKGSGATETFTVRKISNGVGVERIFPINSPFVDKIEINKKGQVRRARIFYLRELKGKSARIKEKIVKLDS